MSVSLTRHPFGPYSLVRIGDGQHFFSFVPERNAYVHQIALGGRELLWNYADGEALTINQGHRNLSLLPFANRLGTGRYTWNGQEHGFPINDPETGSALHGFNHNVPFSLATVELGSTSARAVLRFLQTPELDPAAYPFLVLFEVELSIDTASGQFGWRMTARNLDVRPVPVGFGWHPYFRAESGIEGWSVAMPPNRRVELVEGLPTGRLLEGLPPEPTAVDARWDNCYRLQDGSQRGVTLQGPEYGIRLEQGGDTRYTQLFVPPSRDAVAIEPVTCGVDAFRQNQDEVELAAGASTAAWMKLQMA